MASRQTCDTVCMFESPALRNYDRNETSRRNAEAKRIEETFPEQLRAVKVELPNVRNRVRESFELFLVEEWVPSIQSNLSTRIAAVCGAESTDWLELGAYHDLWQAINTHTTFVKRLLTASLTASRRFFNSMRVIQESKSIITRGRAILCQKADPSLPRASVRM